MDADRRHQLGGAVGIRPSTQWPSTVKLGALLALRSGAAPQGIQHGVRLEIH